MRRRRLKNAARWEFFIFMGEVSVDEAQTGYLPACDTLNGFVFVQPAGCMWDAKTFVLKEAYVAVFEHEANVISRLNSSAEGVKKIPTSDRSAHAAVGSPVHLGHLASDDISLETPATNPGRCAFSQYDVMTRW